MHVMKFIQYGPKSILAVNFTYVVKFSHMSLFSSMDQFDFHVEFHSYSHIIYSHGFRVIWQCYQNHHFHPQWSNVNQCGESFIHDIVQFLLHNISFDITCGQFHPRWKFHPCHEIHPIYLWHPCARAQTTYIDGSPNYYFSSILKNTYFIFTKIVKYNFLIIRQMTQNPNLPHFPNYPKIIYFTFPIPNWSPLLIRGVGDGDGGAHELVGDHPHLTTFILFFIVRLGWTLCWPMGCSTIEVGVSWMTLTW